MQHQASATTGSRPADQYSVHPTSDLLDDRTRVLKHGDTFAVFDLRGDAIPHRSGSHGLYHEGTRFLSELRLRIEGEQPLLLGSTVRNDNSLLTVDLANPELRENEGAEIDVPGDTIHLYRTRLLYDGACYERLRVTNHGIGPVDITLSVDVDADFADIFEVRGETRPRRGRRLKPKREADGLLLRYSGRDRVLRSTRVTCDPRPAEVVGERLMFHVALGAREETELRLTVACENDASPGSALGDCYDEALDRISARREAARSRSCKVVTANELFNDWVDRSAADLCMMVTDTESGPYPYAGVPWFSTAFGRDGIITAFETLWVEPSVTKGVLRFLAATQARDEVPEADAEPGKILHEMRHGEMAALGEIPFGRYYGSVDATPLFVVLARAYYDRTADRETVEAIWPNIELALGWMAAAGDPDGDGFLEYSRRSSRGLSNQGWKDSNDAVFHRDGAEAHGPIALCEVQAYAHAAWLAGARLALLLGRAEQAVELSQRASRLRERFEKEFWSDELGTYVLALDGDKRPCEVRASNAGHCLFAGIAGEERAEAVADALMGDGMFSGWGVRTVGVGEARYNPMSYHNGSVWPHDNALIAAGMARYGLDHHTLRIVEAQFHASLFMDLHRMPELFCGFPLRQGQGPTLYPVACAPQAWAAASVFLMIQACLGLEIDAPGRQVRFVRPMLPQDVEWLEVRNLEVSGSRVDLRFRRAGADVALEVLGKTGDVQIVVTKVV